MNGESRRYKQGDLFWFNNQEIHSSTNIGGDDRLAIVFDVAESAWRNVCGITGAR